MGDPSASMGCFPESTHWHLCGVWEAPVCGPRSLGLSHCPGQQARLSCGLMSLSACTSRVGRALVFEFFSSYFSPHPSVTSAHFERVVFVHVLFLATMIWVSRLDNCILLENITVLEKYIGFNLSGICLHESRLPLPLVFSYRRDDGHACRQMQPWAHSHLQEDCWPEWCFGTCDYTLVRVKVTVCVVFLHTLTRTPAHPQRDNMCN